MELTDQLHMHHVCIVCGQAVGHLAGLEAQLPHTPHPLESCAASCTPIVPAVVQLCVNYRHVGAACGRSAVHVHAGTPSSVSGWGWF